MKRALAASAVAVSKAMRASSFHWLFPHESDRAAFEDSGLLLRSGCQFHWFNRGYRDFRDYLDVMTSKRRKEIRRERRDAAAAPVEIEMHDGHTATEAHWHAYHALYSSTYDRKWGYPALTPSFFTSVAEALPDRILVVLARRGRTLRRRRALLRGARHAVRPQLGMHRAPSGPALRDVLLPAHRTLHSARAVAVRRRRPGASTSSCAGSFRSRRIPRTGSGTRAFAKPSPRFLADERAGIRRYRAAMERHSPFRNPVGEAGSGIRRGAPERTRGGGSRAVPGGGC